MSTAAAHGLVGKMVKPDWAPLAMDDVRALLSMYPGCGVPLTIESISPRPFSSAGVVATTSGLVFIKRHHRSVRDRAGLLEEHRFMQHLCANGAQVPRIFAASSGDTAIERDEWTYEVHDVPQAFDLYGDALSWTPFRSLAHARSAGESLARLHRAAESFNAPARKARPLVASFSIFAAQHAGNALERYLAARPSLSQSANVRHCATNAIDLLSPFHAELLPLLPSLRPLWTHNDLHASNLLWSDTSDDAHAVATIDFGLSDRTNAVHDLAHAIERNIIEWLVFVDDPEHPQNVPIHLDHLHALLDGYDSVRPLSNDEATALAPMVALCHAEFALSEADYFLGVLHSEQQAQLAYDGWLVGHARWFRSPGGDAFLNTLRKWAASRCLVSDQR